MKITVPDQRVTCGIDTDDGELYGPYRCPWCSSEYFDFGTLEKYVEHVNNQKCVPVAVYCDGGVIKKNPSPIGGTYAWIMLNKDGERLAHEAETYIPKDGSFATNNQTEYRAALEALVYVTYCIQQCPEEWQLTLYSDSKITLARITKVQALKNIPEAWYKRMQKVVADIGLERINPVLLKGHPTQADLERGTSAKKGRPVSEWNKWCDDECRKASAAYLASLVEKDVSLSA